MTWGGRGIAAGIDKQTNKASKQKVNVAANRQFSKLSFFFCRRYEN